MFGKSLLAFLLTVCMLGLMFVSCKREENSISIDVAKDTTTTPTKIKGSGDLTFTAYEPLKTKPIQLFYHIPNNATNQTPILFVFHGTDRNAKFSRDVMIANADKFGFIIIAPEFSEQHYPTADNYNLGNVFIDGDNPSVESLNAESLWTFSVVEPIFEFMKTKIGSTLNTYDVFGHSAGAQFVHRYMLFKPLAKVNRLAAAAAGWYTMFDKSIDFPYGTKKSPVEFANYNNLFNKKVYILIGEQDIDPNSDGLRHNEIVDKQGLNRLTRAQYFYTQSRATANQSAAAFNWKYYPLKGVAHDFSATSNAAAIYFYQ